MGRWRRSAVSAWICAACFGIGAAQAGEEPAVRRLEQIEQRLAEIEDGAAARTLLAERATLFSELIAKDPKKALAWAGTGAARWRGLAPAAALETRGEWEGTLEAIAVDDFRNRRAETRWYLRTAAATFELYAAYPIRLRSGAAARVAGVALGARVAADLVAAAEGPARAASAAACSTTGEQKVAVLMVTTPSFPALPSAVTRESLSQTVFGTPAGRDNTASMNAAWQEMSWGQTWATGDVFGPFALSRDYSCDDYQNLRTAAILAADQTMDLTPYSRLAIIFPVASHCSYGGLDTVGCVQTDVAAHGAINASIMWAPVTPDGYSPSVHLFVHELGHGLGLGHSMTDDYGAAPLGPPGAPGVLEEYGDFLSGMGSGHYLQYAAPHKSGELGWLKPGGFQEASSSGAYQLAPYQSSGLRALRVLRDANADAWLWLEYRQPVGDVDGDLRNLDGSNVFDGALVHYEDSAVSPSDTRLLDFNPAQTPNGFEDAALDAGRSWSDPYSLLTLSVAKGGSGLNVNVRYDQPCASLAVSSATFEAGGGAGAVTVSAPPECAWTASTSASWIRLTSPAAGQGGGEVQFSLDPNTASDRREGYLTIGRQSRRIVQAGALLTVLDMTPRTGSGASGQLTFRFSDSQGYTSISGVYVAISNRCAITMSQSGLASLGGQIINLLSPGEEVSNGWCTISSTGSSAFGAGNLLTVTLQVSFSPSAVGSFAVWAAGRRRIAGWGAEARVGTWTVPPAADLCTYKVSKTTLRLPRQGGTDSLSVTAPAACPWTAVSAVPWLTVTAGASGSGSGTVTVSAPPNGGPAFRETLLRVAGNGVNVEQGGSYVIGTVAGGASQATPAPAASATLLDPAGVAVDREGNTYVSASGQHMVFRLDRQGRVLRVAGTGKAGYSGDGGTATSAELDSPEGLAVDRSGNLYIADMGNDRVRKVSPDGTIVTLAGGGGSGPLGDGGPAVQASLSSPWAVAVDDAGGVYIADGLHHRVRKVSPDGAIATIAGNGQSGFAGDSGPATEARLGFPQSVAVNAAGDVFISTGNRIRKVSSDGTIATAAGNGECGYAGDGGPAASAQLCYPAGLAVDAAGVLYIADNENCRIRKISGGTISTMAGSCEASSPIRLPYMVAVDAGGNAFVTDQASDQLWKAAPNGAVAAVAGGGLGDGGPALFAQLFEPSAVAKDAAGNLYIADSWTQGVRKVSPDGVVSTVAGNAQFSSPSGVAVDGSNNLYIADRADGRVWKAGAGGVFSVVAGGGTADPGDGGPATAALLYSPNAVTVDGAGNLYIADSSAHRIRKVAAGGTITTVAGNGSRGYSGDGGPAAEAQLFSPRGVAADGAGNLYIADSFNSRVRKVAASGTISTVAGTGEEGQSGDGGPAIAAQLWWPEGVAVDAAGALYISDPIDCRIRRVAPDGVIGTIAGSGSCGYSGDGKAATLAQLNSPGGVAVDSTGAVYIADRDNSAVRVATPGPALTVAAAHGGVFTPGQNGSTYQVTVGNAHHAGTSSGPVTLTARLTEGLTLVSMAGAGWSCVANACTRADALAGGAGYPPVTVTVNVAPDAPSQATAQFSALGGGGAPGRASLFEPIVSLGSRPVITAVVGAASFLPGVVDGSWITVLGSHLAGATRTWRNDEIVDGALPVALDGVRATVNGLPAAVHFISPGQLNLQAPSTGAAGPVDVVVSNSLGQASASALVVRNAPGLFLFMQGGGKYPAAQYVKPDFSLGYVGPAGLFGDAAFTRPAKPGEVIVLWATGLGPASPPVEPGRVFTGAARLVDDCRVTVGGLEARVEFAGITGAGLYQLNVTLPANLPAGEQPVVVTVNGAASQPGVVLAVAP